MCGMCASDVQGLFWKDLIAILPFDYVVMAFTHGSADSLLNRLQRY